MSVEVYPIQLGFTGCYVIRDGGTIMVDAGGPRQLGAFQRALANTPIQPADIQLIILTHGHFDHAGSAGPISELTGAPIAAHALDVDLVEGERVTEPTPQTALLRAAWWLLSPLIPVIARTMAQGCAAPVDIVVGDEGLSLEDYGVDGRIIYTPGHTAGSLSVVLESGDAFVGCMAHSGPPFRVHPDFPVFADDPDQLRRSWQKLLEVGVKTIHPGHGPSFPVESIFKPLESHAWGRHKTGD